MVNETLNTLWHTVYISVDTALIFHFHFCSGCRGVWTTPFEHAHIPLSIFGGLWVFELKIKNKPIFTSNEPARVHMSVWMNVKLTQHNKSPDHTGTQVTYLEIKRKTKVQDYIFHFLQRITSRDLLLNLCWIWYYVINVNIWWLYT